MQSLNHALHILDGAYFAHRSWHMRHGAPLDNFIGLVLELLTRERPTHFVIAWEHEGDTFRHKLYKPYKAHRPPQPPELQEHIRVCRAAMEAFGTPVIAMENLEGDDVAASLARMWVERTPRRAYVHTADKDLLQLVDPRTVVVIQAKHHDRESVVQKMGVTPEQVPDLLALAGDSVDGIPGIPGIGKQTAAKYLGIWNDIDGIFANRHTLTEAKRRALWENRDDLEIFRRLTVVDRDVEVPVALAETALVPDLAELMRFGETRGVAFLRSLPAYDEPRHALEERVAIMCGAGTEPRDARDHAACQLKLRLHNWHTARASAAALHLS